MPVVHLVRHGQASFGAADYDVLSELGRAQSATVGATLGARGLRAPLSVSGSLRRQRDTALLAGFPSAVDPRWDEYDHRALLARYCPGRTSSDSASMQALLDEALTAWVDDPHGGWPDFSAGAVAALAALDLPRGRDAVVFTSGGVIAAVCADLLGLGAAGVVALNRVAVNGALTKLAVGARGTTLVTFNEHGHLRPEDVTHR